MKVKVIKQVKLSTGETDLFADDAIPEAEVVGFGILTTDHATSSYGQPVLLLDGAAYDVASVALRGWEVLDAETVYPAASPAMFEVWKREWTRIAYQQV